MIRPVGGGSTWLICFATAATDSFTVAFLMVWRFRISKRDRPFRFARSRVSKFLSPKGRSSSAGSRHCKNDHATCCRTSQIRTHCFRRSRCQLCLLIRFACFRSETRNPFLRAQFCPFSPTWRSLSLGSPWVLPAVLGRLSPPEFFLELVSGLVLELSWLSLQEWHSASAGVAVAVGFGVADGNSISLFAVVTTGFSSAASSCSDSLDSVLVAGCFG